LVTLATPQLSVVTGKPRATPVAVQPVLVKVFTSVGQVIVGNSLSDTVTVCVQVMTLPLASVAVQVTVVVPIGNATGASLVTIGALQLSAAVGTPSATPVAVQPALVRTFTSAGHAMLGAMLSCTVTVASQVELLPL
jgi:hypothetical protein